MECLSGSADCKIPIGRWIAVIFDFLKTYFDWLFDAIKFGLTAALDGLIGAMLASRPYC